MRVINIIGHSNSGKTTIVTKLVPLLAKVSTVCTIKHMGHHIWELPPGKDTTVHYDAGATCGAGIDAEKTVLTLRGTDVYLILDFYAWMGYDYAVVEGFKDESFSCAVLGDLSAKNCILTDPSVEELFAARDLFDEYVSRR
ncbi:MAG TPA: molybdopterin-guanine dinucleotide biosynthesis protein MobB [Methanocorpusculum sp.]|nr:molybdopterin-guanine dinucleotide biosynthesis protein MobB [Methanocorpusculum sp.]